jgi:DNA-binding LacI/PurR family transcriptional regulator
MMLIGQNASRRDRRLPGLGDVPVIVADRQLSLPNADAVRIDDGGMRQLVGHLVDLGHRRSGAGGTGYVSADPRLEGYVTMAVRLADRVRVVDAGGSAREEAAAMRLISEVACRQRRRLQRPRRLRHDRRPLA